MQKVTLQVWFRTDEGDSLQAQLIPQLIINYKLKVRWDSPPFTETDSDILERRTYAHESDGV